MLNSGSSWNSLLLRAERVLVPVRFRTHLGNISGSAISNYSSSSPPPNLLSVLDNSSIGNLE